MISRDLEIVSFNTALIAFLRTRPAGPHGVRADKIAALEAETDALVGFAHGRARAVFGRLAVGVCPVVLATGVPNTDAEGAAVTARDAVAMAADLRPAEAVLFAESAARVDARWQPLAEAIEAWAQLRAAARGEAA